MVIYLPHSTTSHLNTVSAATENKIFRPVQTGPGAHPAICKMGTGSFPGGKVRPGRAADHSPTSSAAVMEEYSYTSTHPLGHTGPVTGSLYLYLYLYMINILIILREELNFQILHEIQGSQHKYCATPGTFLRFDCDLRRVKCRL